MKNKATTTPNLGPLANVISKPKFVDGVLTRATIVKDANHLAGHALWSTVVRLDAGQYTAAEYAKVYRHPVMKALRVVRVDGADDLVKLCTARRAWPFETLIVDWLRSLDEARVLASPSAMPNLRELEVRSVPDNAARTATRESMRLFAAMTLARLRMELTSSAIDLGAIVTGANVARLELVDDLHLGTEYGFVRDAAGKLSRLSVSVEFPETSRKHQGMWTSSEWPDAILDRLEQALGSLPPKFLTELVLTPKPALKKPANLKRFAAIAKRFGP